MVSMLIEDLPEDLRLLLALISLLISALYGLAASSRARKLITIEKLLVFQYLIAQEWQLSLSAASFVGSQFCKVQKLRAGWEGGRGRSDREIA